MKIIRNGAIALTFLGVMLMPTAHAKAATIEEMLAQIQTLMTQIQELQKQLATIKGDVQQIIRDGIAEGMTGDDIKKLQELLATDPTIYPEGLTTGYFGPLTKQALKRFQLRHGIEATGDVNIDTQALLNQYLSEGFGDVIPPGLLRAPGIMKKVEERYAKGCDKADGGGHGMGPLCKKLKAQYGDDDDDDDADDADDDDDDSTGDDTTTTFDVSVDVELSSTTVTFTYENEDYSVTVQSTSANTLLAAVADELDVSVSDLDQDLEDEIRAELKQAKADDVIEQQMNVAQTALDDAEQTIEDVQALVTAAEDGDAKDAAQALLDDANDKLDAAQTKFDDEDYSDAEDLANEATDLANQAEEELN